MLPFRPIYHDAFTMDLGDHPFPVHKYRRVREKLIELGVATDADFLAPSPATDEDILRVHRHDYVEQFKAGTFSQEEIRLLEIPWSESLVRSMWLFADGAILAARYALRDGCAVLIGGGFHHAFRDHGEGFCPINDTAVSIAALRVEGILTKTAIVDLDVHQGNGNADLFLFDCWTHTLSLHHEDNYPPMKPPSTVDVGLPGGMCDDEHLVALEGPLAQALATEPDLVWYLAGADPYERDRLGGLSLTLKGLKERDGRVFRAARDAGVPIAVALAGGYAVNPEDTATIHTNTVLTAGEVFGKMTPIDLVPSRQAGQQSAEWPEVVRPDDKQ
jgi:acetoin utilization deacetylase AcuC-like enzyme